jgi:hypothetical protein
MKIQSLIAFRKTGLVACLFTVSNFSVALAQSKGYSCDPSPAVKA